MFPSVAKELASIHNVQLPQQLFDALGFYRFTSFEDFLEVYRQVGTVIRKHADLQLIAQSYLERARAEGAMYIEFMLSPTHSIANGIAFDEQIEAISAAEACVPGIHACVIVTALRHHGMEEAERVAQLATSQRHPIIRGFGLAGNELVGAISDFQKAYHIAGGAGLGLTAHVGEWGSARSVLQAVECLNLTRVGHGIAAARDARIVRELSDRGIGFEICQAANTTLRAVNVFNRHPIADLVAAGCRVVLGTDDPAYFRTSIRQEYAAAAELLSPTQYTGIFSNAVDLAFCGEEIKRQLRAADAALRTV